MHALALTRCVLASLRAEFDLLAWLLSVFSDVYNRYTHGEQLLVPSWKRQETYKALRCECYEILGLILHLLVWHQNGGENTSLICKN